MNLEAQFIAAGYSIDDIKKFLAGFTQGLKEMGITDAPDSKSPLIQEAPKVIEVAQSPSKLDKILIKLGCSPILASTYGPILETAMKEFNIQTPKTCAMFIAQVLHESGKLTATKENLNYSEQALVTVFGKYFDRNMAKYYARNPEKIANRVYANRMGNGDEKSGDGWRYRGRGLIQLTGKSNYINCGKALGKDLVTDPTYLETPEGAARSAGWYWSSRGLNRSAEAGDITTNTRLINGGLNGYDDRVKLYKAALPLF